MKYAYSFDEEGYTGTFDTPDAAAAEAMSDASEDHGGVWIGEVKQPVAHDFVDAEAIIENAQCQAGDECGEWAEDWLASLNHDQIQELKTFVGDWLQRHDAPSFFTVENAVFHSREQMLADGWIDEGDGNETD